MNLNKVLLFGNLTRSPELKSLPSGISVVNFSIATNRTWKDKEGNKKEDVEFHNVVAFGKTAETINQWVKKGQGIFVDGRLQTRSWDKDGQKHYRTEIVVDSFQFGPKTTAKTDTNESELSDTEEPQTPENDEEIPL